MKGKITVPLILGLFLILSLTASTSSCGSPGTYQVIRIDQTSTAQYTNTTEYNTWSDSSCSAAAITEIINAYGHSYTIHDILSTEIQLNQISVDQGLLYGLPSIKKIVESFGFQASSIDGSFDGIIATANAGNPVVISMRNASWPNGHILVATGGNTQTIKVVDSWNTDKTSFTRTDFQSYFSGLAATITPSTDYRQLARQDATNNGIDPTLFVNQINQESGFNPNVTSSEGAIGIAQIMPATAQSWNVDPHDPVASLSVAASHMAWYQHRYGSIEKALAAYNAGSERLNTCIANYADWYHCLPLETQRYITIITGNQ